MPEFCIRLNYRYRGSSSYTQESSCETSFCIALGGTYTLPDAVVGTPYSYSFTLTGDSPFDTGNPLDWNIPTWMVVHLDNTSGEVLLDGTPDAPATDFAIHITFTNCDGANTFDVDGTIQVTEVPVCVCVGISGTPVLPDGYVGVPYSYAINLTGDAPYTLNIFDKPSWMLITINVDQIAFGGTPDVAASSINVSLEVSNCEGGSCDPIPFTGTLDINDVTNELEISFVMGLGVHFIAQLNATLSDDIIINEVHAEGHPTSACDSESADAAFTSGIGHTIEAGTTTEIINPESTFGDWTSTSRYSIFDVKLNGSSLFITNNQIIFVGSTPVKVILIQCGT